MKLRYILIVLGSMLLLFCILSIAVGRDSSHYWESFYIIGATIGLGTLLIGVFWKKQ